MPEFSSEGFDLDALAAATDDVVLELGGKVVAEQDETKKGQPPIVKSDDPLHEAESLKQQGNDAFKQKEWQQAYDLYSKAIAATPGMKGAELLKAQLAWQEEQHQKMREKLRRQNLAKSNKQEENNDDSEDKEEGDQPETFVPPSHPHGSNLAVYYSNRAASSMQLAQQEQPAATPPTQPRSPFDDPDDDDNAPPRNPRLEEAVRDCSVAILLNPVYAKAWVRRATAHERQGDTELALKDARQAQTLEPGNATVRATVQRLQKLEDERLERLKTETLGKLKDLGNSILGNFGLSLDSFNAQKDPNTGSYSISFNQGNNNGSAS